MPFRADSDYETVRRASVSADAESDSFGIQRFKKRNQDTKLHVSSHRGLKAKQDDGNRKLVLEQWSSSRGHAITFIALLTYTAIAYFRPYELSSALAWTSVLPYWIAIGMLVIFIPSQLIAENSLTARPKEVNLVLVLGLIAVFSIPQAINVGLAWEVFSTLYFKTILVFIVMINVLRTENRLRMMILFSLVTGGIMSISALVDYSSGKTGTYENRAIVSISNMFGEPNSLALHLVMMIPLAVVLTLSSGNILKRALYFVGSLVMIVGVFATFSRGGFLGLVGAGLLLAWKLARKNRFAVLGIMILATVAVLFFAPGGYGARVTSIFNPSGEASASARRALLSRSIWVGLRSPLLGVGIGNLRIVLIHDQVSHNAFTQISGDLGLIAFTLYLMLLIVPYRRLATIERETLREESHSRFYYLSVGLQASLLAYMVSSFFLSVAYEWYGYFIVAYAVALRRLYSAHIEDKRSVTSAGIFTPVQSIPTEGG